MSRSERLSDLLHVLRRLRQLVSGQRRVAKRTDGPMAEAARSTIARTGAILPPEPKDEIETSALRIGPSPEQASDMIDRVLLRRAIRGERKLHLSCRDAVGVATERIVRPAAPSRFDQVRVLVGWCELREGFRHFRTGRIAGPTLLDARYPWRRAKLFKE